MTVGGLFATTAFDLWGQIVSPALGFAALSPHGLAQSLLGRLGLPNNAFAGFFVHFYAVGLIAYPAGWLFAFRPIFSRLIGAEGWLLPSAIYGLALWVFAIGVVTTVAGLPPFLSFSGVTWVALNGHVLYGIVLGAVVAVMERSN